MQLSNYRDEDFFEVMDFLAEIYQLNEDQPYWLPGRWEYAAYLVHPLFQERGYPDWKEYIQLLKIDGKIVGIVNSENPDQNVYVHIHPDYKDEEPKLISWAEQHFNTGKIDLWVSDFDVSRKEYLRGRGYVLEQDNDYLNYCVPSDIEPSAGLDEKYRFRSYSDRFDIASRIECTSRAFDGKPYSQDVYAYMQKAPSYDPELDLTITIGEKVVAVCTVWNDKKNAIAYFEPVAVHPDCQGQGLGRAIVTEGLSRLKDMHVGKAFVGAAGDWRREFYRKCGFHNFVLANPWRKSIPETDGPSRSGD